MEKIWQPGTGEYLENLATWNRGGYLGIVQQMPVCHNSPFLHLLLQLPVSLMSILELCCVAAMHSDFDASPDLILTEDINGVNAGRRNWRIVHFYFMSV